MTQIARFLGLVGLVVSLAALHTAWKMAAQSTLGLIKSSSSQNSSVNLKGFPCCVFERELFCTLTSAVLKSFE